MSFLWELKESSFFATEDTEFTEEKNTFTSRCSLCSLWLKNHFCHFDFKKMGNSTTNPWIIKGEDLQWQGYFFSPYYDKQKAQSRVKELLQKEGIFLPV